MLYDREGPHLPVFLKHQLKTNVLIYFFDYNFQNYYFEDLNLKEIADNNNISRSYVGKYIKQIEDKLIEYEKCLNIYEKNNKIREIIKFSDLKERIEEIL